MIFRVHVAFWNMLGISFCHVVVERGSRRQRDQWFVRGIIECDERKRTDYVRWCMDVVNHCHHGLSSDGGSRKKAFVAQLGGA